MSWGPDRGPSGPSPALHGHALNCPGVGTIWLRAGGGSWQPAVPSSPSQETDTVSRTTRAGQIQYLLRLLDACPGPCRVVLKNPALPSGVVVQIPVDEPAAPAEFFTISSPAADGGLPAVP
jgi:hypothetical protein